MQVAFLLVFSIILLSILGFRLNMVEVQHIKKSNKRMVKKKGRKAVKRRLWKSHIH